MTVHIDWVSARIPWPDGVLTGGELIMVDADGVVTWEAPRRRMCEGSHSSSVAVRASGGILEWSGNPTKWLQGHNVFGSPSLVPLMSIALERLASRLSVDIPADILRTWHQGDYDLTRVDVTRMYRLPSPDDVRAWLTAAGTVARTRQQKSELFNSTTLYLGRRSRRVAVKFYDKLAELQTKGHRLPESMPRGVQIWLMTWAVATLRCELTMRGMELERRGLKQAGNWTAAIAERELDARLELLELNDTLRLSDSVVNALPRRLLGAYEAWRAGHDMRRVFGSKATFYRYRRELLAHGVDIRQVTGGPEPCPDGQYMFGQPLRDYLSGGGCPVPTWAEGTEWLAA